MYVTAHTTAGETRGHAPKHVEPMGLWKGQGMSNGIQEIMAWHA